MNRENLPQPDIIRSEFKALAPSMNERERRLWAASQARSLPRGGVSLVARLTGMSRTTIQAGMRELRSLQHAEPFTAHSAEGGARRPGGGRKSLATHDPRLVEDLTSLLHPRGCEAHASPLRWTCQSTRALAEELNRGKHRIGERTVGELLKNMNYALQEAGRTPADQHGRNAQFNRINTRTRAFHRLGQAVVSVGIGRKKMVGRINRHARNRLPIRRIERFRHSLLKGWTPEERREDRDTDWMLGLKWVSARPSVGTVKLAMETVHSWWEKRATRVRRGPNRLLLVAGGTPPETEEARCMREAIGELARDTGLHVTVSHAPRGTSAWTRVIHHISCQIALQSHSGSPVLHEVTVQEVGEATPVLENPALAEPIELERPDGVWNYTVRP